MRIEISGLTKTYKGKVPALDGLDLLVPTGMFGLLGANGAGKTTLMRILAGLLRPTSGDVRIGGNDVTSRAGRQAVQRVLGYLPQDLGVYPDLSAREFLDYVGLLKGIDDRATRRRRVGELLEVVALTSEADRRLRGYSGGMRRRVGIAQALLADPRLLIVDEPTAGLDPEERIRFRTLLSQLAGSARCCSAPTSWTTSRRRAGSWPCWRRGGWSSAAPWRTSPAAPTVGCGRWSRPVRRRPAARSSRRCRWRVGCDTGWSRRRRPHWTPSRSARTLRTATWPFPSLAP
ncbi:ATP-binding cassette domain-containing protein [Phytohabitans flavus]|uniref:ATP-binding cassette domain-containing protein n=1 Tax=Phytohabitans flavus TaxID=1076124 RepID=UPI00363A4C5F